MSSLRIDLSTGMLGALSTWIFQVALLTCCSNRDVDAFHLETKASVDATSVKVLEDGPLRASLVASYHIGNSHIKAHISLDAVSTVAKADALSLIRFDTEVKWFEKHRWVKEGILAIKYR